MAAELITGPPYAQKTQTLLRAYRDRLEDRPVLVAPTVHAADQLERTLCRLGVVFGTCVVTAQGLFDLIAKRVLARRPKPRIASLAQRRAVVAEVCDRAGASFDSTMVTRGGFVEALERFFAELGSQDICSDAFADAVERAQAEGAQVGCAKELSRVYSRYRARLAELGLTDPKLWRAQVLEALNRDPKAWGESPAFFCDLDEPTPLELEALMALNAASADIIVSVNFERDRAAFLHTAPVVRRLKELVETHTEIFPDTTESAREPALCHLERGLFEHCTPREAGSAVSFLAAGGERAEIELVARRVLELLREGTEPARIAVCFRDLTPYFSLVDQIFTAYGVPFSLERQLPLERTALGRGLLALARCGTPAGTSTNLVSFLRTPGVLDDPSQADALEAAIVRRGLQSADEARRIWRGDPAVLEPVMRLLQVEDVTSFIEELRAASQRLLAAPRIRGARVLSALELEDAAAANTAQTLLAELEELAAADSPLSLGRQRVIDALSTAPVRTPAANGDRVQVLAVDQVAQRRFDVVFIAGLVDGEFPRLGRGEPCLTDEERSELGAATGLELSLSAQDIERERFLFYLCATSADRALYLSWRMTDEEGTAQPRSFFVEDVRDLFSADVWQQTERRPVSQVTWSAGLAPTMREWERAATLAGPRLPESVPSGLCDDAVVASLKQRVSFSASSLETFASCGTRWLVEHKLAPRPFEPDAEGLVRGRHAHDLLRATLERLTERSGTSGVSAANLVEAQCILSELLEAKLASVPARRGRARGLAQFERLRLDLSHALREEARSDTRFEPHSLELGFGGPDDTFCALALGLDGVFVHGRIDRVDTCGRSALVRDYKAGGAAPPGAKWTEQKRLQLGLYLLAVKQLLGLEPVGGVYVPLSGQDRRPRGLLRADADGDLGSGFVANDLRPTDVFDQELESARNLASGLVEQIHAGEIRPCPQTCVCAYPSLCRQEQG